MPEVVFLRLLERALLTLSNACNNNFEYDALKRIELIVSRYMLCKILWSVGGVEQKKGCWSYQNKYYSKGEN